MTINIENLAKNLKLPTLELIEQLKEIGIRKKNINDIITDEEKKKLLNYLQIKNGAKKNERLTITRFKTEKSTIHGVQVETRKRRKINIPNEKILQTNPNIIKQEKINPKTKSEIINKKTSNIINKTLENKNRDDNTEIKKENIKNNNFTSTNNNTKEDINKKIEPKPKIKSKSPKQQKDIDNKEINKYSKLKNKDKNVKNKFIYEMDDENERIWHNKKSKKKLKSN